MDRWLDELSEDWVSQPDSPQSSSAKQNLVLRDASSPKSNGSRSRIPRYKPRVSSILSTATGKELGKTSSMQRRTSNEAALKEKTSSNLNTSHKRLPKGQINAQSPKSTRKKNAGQPPKESSSPVPQDTVQHKTYPAKDRIAQATPEWKRRVLKENAAKGQPDLFSPIGLEGVFRPPTLASRSNIKPTGKRKPPVLEDFPSSPPPFPTLPSHGHGGDPKKPKNSNSLRKGSHDKEISLNDGTAHNTDFGLPIGDEADGNNSIINTRHSSPSTRTHDSVGSQLSSLGGSPVLPNANLNRLTSGLDVPIVKAASKGIEDISAFSAHNQTRNEDISPLYVSRHNTVDGHVEYAAIDMSLRQLRSQMDELRLQQQNLPSSRSSDYEIDYADSRHSEKPLLREQMNEVTSQSLPDDLSMGTDAYAANGGFVSIRRGGYSNDGSFQRRPLSPSSPRDLDGPGLRSSSKASKSARLPKFDPQNGSRRPSSLPRTPRKEKVGDPSSQERPRSSGSPLKLFDKYDTFTNDRLVRRMSKFEETLDKEMQEEMSADGVKQPSSPSPGPKRSYYQKSSSKISKVCKSRRISSFGDGELDDHRFPPHQQSPSLGQVQHGPDTFRSPPRSPNDPRFQHLPSSPSAHKISSDSRARPKRMSGDAEHGPRDGYNASGLPARDADDTIGRDGHHPWENRQTVHGKRLPHSPAKDPAPKRRRTIRISEVVDEEFLSIQNHVEIKETPVQSVSGKKRKDARYDNDCQAADPSVIAMRQILHPRTPMSNHTVSSTRKAKAGLSDHSQKQAVAEDEASGTVQYTHQAAASSVDPPTQIVAGALATVALNTVQDITCGSRKASVTTADFFNEAQQIMQLIRTQGRPHSSQTTADGSEADYPTILEESVIEDFTKDEFSRPPSREGGTLPKLREPVLMNARVVSHLRKFEDKEDLGLALSSSLKSLHVCQSGKEPTPHTSECDKNENHQSGTESDPPNIRIMEGIVQSHKRKYSSSVHDVSGVGTDQKFLSQASHSTTCLSTSRSNPTGSSHSSTNRMVIAPETVAHLLTDQMAGMVFDRDRQLWIKRKGSANGKSSEPYENAASEATDEDLFGDIPDLTVDEMEELRRVKEAVSSVKSLGSADQISHHDQAAILEIQEELPKIGGNIEDIRPKTADRKSINAVEDSSAPSKFSHFTSSGPVAGTRATSWGDDVLSPRQPQVLGNSLLVSSTGHKEQHVEEVEHEISILEGRESCIPTHRITNQRQARVVTVAFSSPLVDQREPLYAQDDIPEFWEEGSELILEDSPTRHGTQQSPSSNRRTSFGVTRRSGHRGASRRVSIGNQSYIARPMSPLDEQDETSVVHCSIGNRHMSMDVAITTPLPVSRSLMIPPSTTAQQSSIGFHLSPLPDFTIHQIDKPVDEDQGEVARRHDVPPVHSPDNRLSFAAQNLVKNLTDLEPYEPYWDYIRSVGLNDRKLKTLHMLEDFCGRVEELDVSNNQIGELDGIPRTVRLLNIRGNCLTELTAWNHLPNLQYLDLSDNQLQSLKGLQGLVHLRALRADNNEIESLDGLELLDGLISLRLRANKLAALNFENFDL